MCVCVCVFVFLPRPQSEMKNASDHVNFQSIIVILNPGEPEEERGGRR